MTESPRQTQRTFLRAERAIMQHDQPAALTATGPTVHRAAHFTAAATAQTGIAMAVGSIKRPNVRQQVLAAVPPARTSRLPEEGTAGYNAGGSHNGHAPGFMGQYYFLGTNTGPSGFGEYDDIKATSEGFPVTIDFKNSGDFSRIDPSLANGQIAARWVGKIEITKEGSYDFKARSTNSSWVYIDGEMAVSTEDEASATSGGIFLSQGYHAFRAEFFANTKDENMQASYKGPDTDNSWELVEGTHRTDFDYLNALSLTNLPNPRPDQLPMGSSRNTWSNIIANKRNMIFCFTYFHYLKTRENCVHDFTGGPLLK